MRLLRVSILVPVLLYIRGSIQMIKLIKGIPIQSIDADPDYHHLINGLNSMKNEEK